MAQNIPKLWIQDAEATAIKLQDASRLGARLVLEQKALKSETSKMAESTGVKTHCKELLQKIEDLVKEVTEAKAAPLAELGA